MTATRRTAGGLAPLAVGVVLLLAAGLYLVGAVLSIVDGAVDGVRLDVDVEMEETP